MPKPLLKTKNAPRLSFEEREALILDTATEIFSEKGFDGATTKAIANRAGINEALLFRHFPNKESLYTALLQRKISRLFADVIPPLEKTLTDALPDALFAAAKTFIAEHRKDPGLLRMMLYSALEGHHQSRFFFHQRLPFRDFLERLLNEKKGKGLVKKTVDVRTAARAFLGMILSYILHSQIFKVKFFYPKPEDDLLRDYVEIFTRGVSA